MITGTDTDDGSVRNQNDDNVGGRASGDDITGVLFSRVRCCGRSCLQQIG